ncbi:amino acid ABC transporter substrate-binding protein [Alteromonas sediminis]|uniref:Amino acid ABC transporter substrate-binding protein n=1 Tax=Alteromonas sediminis TaxID=2259342 RepID=A0A3N5XWF1_9ALTE|nr:transporter substrate-binding domain-containing protein [Alteromonas sediminis]RPJ64942.1 amino acid ABC transporter substrate-binding protein [Alteromonas sediminis]
MSSAGIFFFLSLTFAFSAYSQTIEVTYPFGKGVTVVGEQQGTVYRFSQGNRNTLRGVTLDWPPYIAQSLCDKGWVFRLAVATVLESGFDLEIVFLPWARAVREAEQGKADFLFPEYFIEETAPSDNFDSKTRRQLLALSLPFPGGPIGLTKKSSNDFVYNGDLLSLQTKLVGVVRGYQNTPAFDKLMDNGILRVTEATDDNHLLRLLLNGRVDVAVGDPLVFDDLYQEIVNGSEPTTLPSITHLTPSLGVKDLYFAFSKQTPDWQATIQLFNQTLLKFTNNSIIERLRAESEEQCQRTTQYQPQP